MRTWETQLKPENITHESCISAWHKLQCRLIWSTSWGKKKGKEKRGSVALESVLNVFLCVVFTTTQHPLAAVNY